MNETPKFDAAALLDELLRQQPERKIQEPPPPEITPFETFDAGDWEGMPIEPRRWIVHHRIHAGEPGIMSGDGGTGKTKLMLQLAVAVGAELPDWIGGIPYCSGAITQGNAPARLE